MIKFSVGKTLQGKPCFVTLNSITLKQQVLEVKQRLQPSKNIYLSKVITSALGTYFENVKTTTNQQMWEGIKLYLQHSVSRGINSFQKHHYPYFSLSCFLHLQTVQACPTVPAKYSYLKIFSLLKISDFNLFFM